MVDQANDVFNKDSQPDTKTLVDELVGEGKKFKTAEDLARGKLEADIHIKRLEDEAKVMREKLAAAKAVEDVLEAVKANAAVGQNLPNDDENDDKGSSAQPSISAEQVAQIVAEQITGRETARQKETNKQQANALMVQMFGDKAKEVFDKEAATPELRATLIQLAEVSPEKFAAFFKREVPAGIVDSGSRSKNTAALSSNLTTGTPTPGTQAYYSKLRKENPKQYFSPAVQLEMHNAALKDPAKYFGR